MIEPRATDLGNAERFANDHLQEARFCHAQREWLIWDGRRWKTDVLGRVFQLAKATVRRMQQEALEVTDQRQRFDLMQHALKSESEPRMRSMLKLAETEPGIAVDVKELDTDPMLFNVRTGTIELETGKLRAHRREDLITKIAPVDFDPLAKSPRWEKFLVEVMGGEEELIQYVQRAVGYSLTGRTSEQVMFMLHGDGANGKTTFLETLRFVFGDYAAATAFNSLLVAKNNGGPRNDLAKLQGARYVTAAETDDSSRLDEAVIKQLTGCDVITARELYQAFHDFTPQFKLWLGMNHLPTIRGTDHAIWRRVHLIPFSVRITDDRCDRDLVEKLKLEASGILAWALAGLREHQRIGLKPPATVLEATADYRGGQDTVGQFLTDKCQLDATATTTGRSLYQTYRTWTAEVKEPWPMSQKRFSQVLASREGLQKLHSREGTMWLGIRLANCPEPDWAIGSKIEVN